MEACRWARASYLFRSAAKMAHVIRDQGTSARVGMVRSRVRLFLLAIAIVFCFWGLTATWGIADVVATAHQSAQGLNQELGPLNRLDFDPDVRPSLGEKKMPWYFVGNASSPFPFIVAVDFVYAVGSTAGQRSREYIFWFFGLKLPVYQRVDWMS
ncbi:MAG: hypothetical protein JSS49_27880 [Planctomycetes bacterium]|nr:hypothetical protein [Planctomycetota bacterium]